MIFCPDHFKTIQHVNKYEIVFHNQQHHRVGRSLVCVEGRGKISRSCLIQDIKMGSCVFTIDVPHQWIAQRQVGPGSVYCDGVGVMPCPVSAAWHSRVAAHWSKYLCYK